MTKGGSEFLGAAFRAALLAGDLIVDNIGRISNNDIHTKDVSDFVTRVDRESEELILRTIRRKFPDHHFLAEESAREGTEGSHRWIIDPLDGTTNFIHRYPVFSVSIALEYEGEIILGVVYDPLRHEMFTAEKGAGAFLNGRPIAVSRASDPRTCLVTTGFPFRKKDLIDPYLKLFKDIFYKVSDIRRAGSAALDLAHLAAGRCDCFFEIGLSPWDIAAGVILIREAGGIVTDFGGGSAYMETGNIVCASPAIHKEILGDVRNVFSGLIDR